MQSRGMQWTIILITCSCVATTFAIADPDSALPGCSNRCGDVIVPYPFGIDIASCAKNFNLFLICNRSTTPAKLQFIGFPVLNVSLEQGIMIVSLETTYRCNDSSASAISSAYDFISSELTPFKFSYTRNKFVALGCDTLAYMVDPDNSQYGNLKFKSGCVSLCQGALVKSNSCSGVGCCQTPIPEGLKLFLVQLTSTNGSTSTGGCGYAFLVDQDSLDDIILNTNLTSYSNKAFETPVALDWFTQNKTCAEARFNATEYACGPNTFCSDSTNGPGYHCFCNDGFNGNPYFPQGCQDIDECSDPLRYPCQGSCKNTFGSYICKCPLGMHGDGKVRCRGIRIAILLVGISFTFGMMLLIAGLYLLHRIMTKKNHVRLKKKYFEKNGGMLFEQQISVDNGRIEKSKIFAAEALEKATDNYNENRILGKGGQGTVYKGMLSDGTIVAIKKSCKIDEGQTQQFINEVVILSQINHKHVVKILGCCLETEVPLLVYEFISNGTLSSHIHHPKEEFFLRWTDRLRIAKEVAGALAYIHSAASLPIYHRDIKSSNILLDEKLRAKVADFGISRSVSSDKTHLTTLVQGTFGYLDPEYFQSNQFTEKSDVYSYGVILVELLTGRKPISNVVTEEQRGLAAQFISAMEEGLLFDVLDSNVVAKGHKEELIVVANLAKRCLSLSGRERPTMVEVVLELENLNRSQEHLIAQQHQEEEDYFCTETSQDWDRNTTANYSEFGGNVNTDESELALLNNGR